MSKGTPKRPFTDAERDAVRSRYASEGAIPLALAFGRKRADIVSIAQRLGVTCDLVRRWAPSDHCRMVELKLAGKPAAAIAADLNRTPSAVAKRLQSCGFSVATYDPVARRAMCRTIRQPTKNQCETRWARARIAIGEHGWPPDLNPKEIVILGSLLANGPQTRLNLSRSIGEPDSRPVKKRLMTHGGVSSMARLLARGLVARLRLNMSRKFVCVYAITGYALEQRGNFGSVLEFNREAAQRGLRATPRKAS